MAQCLGVERHGEEVLLVVEHVAGRDLGQAHRQRALRPAEAAQLIEQAAEGLAAVHACGLLHRDLKPANILLGDDGLARLVDFGLAAGVGSAILGELSGTPAYMAPEQARGEPERIGPRTDVFGLGAVLYFLLTGSAPFHGRDLPEALELARQGRVTAPRTLNPRVPRALEQICLRALAADPGGRPATAADLAARLEHFTRGPRRTVGAAGAVLLLAALGLWAWPRLRVGPAPMVLAAKQSLIQVERDRRLYELWDALPLRTRDGLRITCDVPRGERSALSLFWLDSEGQLIEIEDFHLEPGVAADRLTYPSPGEVFDLVGPPGTEFALVCIGRDGPIPLAEVQALLGTGSRWPALPGEAILTVAQDGVQEIVPPASRAIGATRPSQFAGARTRWSGCMSDSAAG